MKVVPNITCHKSVRLVERSKSPLYVRAQFNWVPLYFEGSSSVTVRANEGIPGVQGIPPENKASTVQAETDYGGSDCRSPFLLSCAILASTQVSSAAKWRTFTVAPPSSVRSFLPVRR